MMENKYTNEDQSLRCISLVNTSAGAVRQQHLKELCRYKTRAADQFWSSRIRDESYLPYIMMCRSEQFSDYAADRFNDFLDRLLDGGMSYSDIVNEAYFLLHVCMFKESDKMIEVYRRIGRNFDKLVSMRIRWNSRNVISPYNQPDFLYKRYLRETEEDCENTFVNFLTDVLILTTANAVVCDGEAESFTAKVRELYDDFPDVYTSPGFFACFINDTREAYDVFGKYLDDPVDYPKIFWVIDGTEYENGCYIQGSPTTFGGPANEKIHFNIRLSEIDNRWYSFLTEKSLEDIHGMEIQELNYTRNYLRSFSNRVYNLINNDDKERLEMCAAYFRRSALISGNPVDFAGLNDCGCIKNGEEFEKLVMDIAEEIASGRQDYCFNILFRFFGSIDREARVRALTKASEYLLENDTSQKNAEERTALIYQSELFASGKKSIFDA